MPVDPERPATLKPPLTGFLAGLFVRLLHQPRVVAEFGAETADLDTAFRESAVYGDDALKIVRRIAHSRT